MTSNGLLSGVVELAATPQVKPSMRLAEMVAATLVPAQMPMSRLG